jgi:hypothetical protein
MKQNAFGLLGICLAAVSAGALAHGPHVHGTADLRVAVENNRVDIEFNSPLENLLGFEHTPKTDAQRAAAKAMMAKLNRPETLFSLSKAASCTAGPVRIESQFNETAPVPAKSTKPARKENTDEDHADLTAAFSFNCSAVANLNTIEVLISDAFPGTRTLKAEIIGPSGQSAATLSAKRRVIRF